MRGGEAPRKVRTALRPGAGVDCVRGATDIAPPPGPSAIGIHSSLEASVRQHPLALVVALATLTLATPASTQVLDPIQCTLTSPSELGYGCAQPCMCAWFVRGPLTGGFAMHLTSSDYLHAHYALLDFAWRWEVPDSTGGTRIETLTGRGTYDVDYLPGVGSQRMQLDLTTEDGFEHHFDSRWVPGPTSSALDIVVPMGRACRDSVVHIVALERTEDVPPTVPGAMLAAAPNPARAGADIQLVLPEPASGQVEVVSVSGQIVAVIANGAFPAGESRLRWDGRAAAGTDAGVGVFWVRARISYHAREAVAVPRLGDVTLTNQFVRLR